MNRLFLRFLGPVLLSIAVATVLVYAVVTWIFGDPIEQSALRQAAPQIFLIEQYIDKAASDEWLARLNKVREVSQVKFELIPLKQALDKLTQSQRQQLSAGKIVMDAANSALYRRVDLDGERYIGSEDDVLQVQDLPIDYWFNIKLEIVRYIIVAFVLLIPIGFWSRAHWRDIQALAKVTEDFGAGRLTARASTPARASIYPLAQQINQMANRIETLLSSQQQLLHSVSHELRTPIARLEFAMEILQDSLVLSDADGKQKQRIIAMQGDLSELNSLVSELLNMAKLDAQGQLQKDVIRVDEFVQNCLQHLPPKPAGLDLQLDIQNQDKRYFADQRLLSRAIQNLLKNAYKYADQKIIWRMKVQGGHWLISVEDDGAGIPESEREKIFEAFYRLDRSRDRATGGFGLGLSIVRQIVVLHGGRINIRESELGGAKFEISLPLAV